MKSRGNISPKGAIRVFHVSLAEVRRVSALDREAYGSRKRIWKALFPPPLPFWLKRNSHLRLFRITIFIADSNVFTIPTI